MALSASTIWEVQTGGDDVNNGGAFDPSQTAGMFTDGAASSSTSATPTFSSASYNFVANDVDAWIYIASGSTYIAGWYKITAVGSNVATLDAAIGHGVLKTTLVPTTVQGVGATAASATWTIDYSQQSTARFTYTDLASAGAGLTVSSAGKPFGKQQVGNSIVITGGTNFNTGRYVIASVGASPTFIATVVGPTNITSGVGANGTGGQGGALASIGIVGGIVQTSNFIFIASGSYNISSASTNISGGCFSAAFSNGRMMGYGTVRGDLGTAPTLTATGTISTFTIINCSGNDQLVANITGDGSSYTSSRAFSFARANTFRLACLNCTNGGINNSNGANILARATGCASVVAILGIVNIACEAYGNTVSGISGVRNVDCISSGNTGASSDGIILAGTGACAVNCTSYGNGRAGFRCTAGSGGYVASCESCIAEANTGVGFDRGTNTHLDLARCAYYNNGTNFDLGSGLNVLPSLGTGTFFVNAAGGDFMPNNTLGGGALLRATGLLGTFPRGTSTGYQDIGAVQARWPMVPFSVQGVI